MSPRASLRSVLSSDWGSHRGTRKRRPSGLYSRSLRVEPLEDRRLLSAGDLDSTFDFDGRVTTDFADGADSGHGVAIQADGKTVVAGSSDRGDHDCDFAVARCNTDGSLDTSFDGDGKLTTDFGPSSFGYSVAIQPDGKIIVAGDTWDYDFAVARYNTNGSLDASFSGDGKLTTDFGSAYATYDEAYSVAIQADGKIVVAGSSHNADYDYDFAVARYNTDGSLDTTFDGDGKLTTDFVSPFDVAKSIAIQADGKIVVAGGSNGDFAVARYNTVGSLDTSFSGDGKLTNDFGSGSCHAYSVAIQANGKIVVAGVSGSDFAVSRYNTDGSLDTSFDADGKLTTDFDASYDGAYSVAIQADGKIVVAGDSGYGSNYDFAVARYRTDGSLDPSFSGDGTVTTDIGPDGDYGNGVAIQADGKIVVAGSNNYDFAVARYEGDPVGVPGDYDGNGTVEETDYTFWKSHFNETSGPGMTADGNGNGTVDAADYTVWRDNLEAGAGAGAVVVETEAVKVDEGGALRDKTPSPCPLPRGEGSQDKAPSPRPLPMGEGFGGHANPQADRTPHRGMWVGEETVQAWHRDMALLRMSASWRLTQSRLRDGDRPMFVNPKGSVPDGLGDDKPGDDAETVDAALADMIDEDAGGLLSLLSA
jgi:uncharacterized delta-60 repeat protein